MITKIAKIEMSANDEQELKLLAQSIQNVVRLPQQRNDIKQEDLIYLLQYTEKHPEVVIQALGFIS